MSKEVVQVVCALIESDLKVLACLRSEDKHLGGLWEFPGGKVEAGEDHQTALKREIREELGVDLEVLEPLASVFWDYGSVRILLHPYRCKIDCGTPHPTEHSAIRWCGPEELGGLEWADADVPIVREWIGSSGRETPTESALRADFSRSLRNPS